MKKTVEQLMDENPDTPHEEIARIYTEQPDDAPELVAQPVPSEQPPVAEQPVQSKNDQEQAGFGARAAAARSKVADLFTERNNTEAGLTKDIQVEEDDIRKTRQSSGTESALLAGGKVMAGTLGGILNYDSRPQVGGFEDAQKAVAGRTDEARQRREFLQQRLYRADDKTKAAGQEMGMRKAATDQAMGEGLSESDFDVKLSGNALGKANNNLGVVKTEANSRKYQSGTLFAESDARITKLKLEAKAKAGGADADIAKDILSTWGTKDISTDFSLMTPDERDELFGKMIEAKKEGKKFSFERFDAGANTGYGSYDESTGTFTKLGEGVKPTNATAGALKARMVSDKQTDTITGIESILAELDGIKKDKSSIDTGPVSAAQNWAAQMVGMDDPKKSAFKARVGEQLSDFIKNKTGATASDVERAELLSLVPKLGDNDATFTEKTNRLTVKLKELRQRTVGNIKKQGKDTSAFDKPPTNSETSSSGRKVLKSVNELPEVK